MAAWPGGPCPSCGEDMPPNMVHCRTCRTLLNPELERDSVEVPVFIPLQELDAMVDISPIGIFVDCPQCTQELKIHKKYLGQRVLCKFCSADFRLDPVKPAIAASDVYSKCPHCDQELRFARKYVGVRVACRFCGGKLNITEGESDS